MRRTRDFNLLVSDIANLSREFSSQARQAVNTSLTLRNWCIGGYIHEYELNGADRADYGERLMYELAKSLKDVSNCNRRQLYRYLSFYRLYPQIAGTLSPQLKNNLSLSPNETVGTVSPLSSIPAKKLLERLSYSHFELLIGCENSTKRAFYEIESIRGNWSVRELKRQIQSLYYERSGLSLNKEKVSVLANEGAEKDTLQSTIRDPYVFEFLGLAPREMMSESHLEAELLNHIEEFLLELGHGFCFEARQKRILIGDTHNFVDLVFYHRILKCHVLVELKLAGFNHENIGQLNTYLSWYRRNVMTNEDNPPVGILLCTDKDHALVEYALAGMDNELFVSKYQLSLPGKEQMQKFIEEKLRETEIKP